MILGRKLFTPPGFIMMRHWSNGKNQYYSKNQNFSRLKMNVKPKDNMSNFFYTVHFKRKKRETPDEEETKSVVGTILDKNTVDICFQQTDLIDNDKLKLELFIMDTNTYRYNKYPFIVDTSKKTDSFKLRMGKTPFDVTTSIATDSDVKFRSKTELCGREEDFVNKRKALVLEKLKKRFEHITSLEPKDVPNIAVIGSGGGMRALIGMCGSLIALEQLGILDYTMYLAGLSGSSWFLMSLYVLDGKLNPTQAMANIRHTLPMVSYWNVLKWQYDVGMQVKDTLPNYRWWNLFSNLTSRFGRQIGVYLMQQKCDGSWSEVANKLEDGSVPLPLIAALYVRNNKTNKKDHVRDEKTSMEDYDWIEFSSYEVLIPTYDAAIDMRNFGKTFYGGFVTGTNGERAILFLLGICGSAYAKIRQFKPSEGGQFKVIRILKDWIRSVFDYLDEHSFGNVPNCFFGLTPFNADSEADFKKTSMLLIDAGLAFNSPYPLVLHPSRKVDVILSFDFSHRGKDTNWPFKQLEKASKWAEEEEIPFPVIKKQLEEIKEKCFEKGDYEEVYVFPGENGAPSIVHFVMINKTYGHSGIKGTSLFKILPKYPTYKFHYSTEEFTDLLKLMFRNVMANNDKIIDCIESAILKKK